MNLIVNRIMHKEYVKKRLGAMAEEKFTVFVDELHVNLFVKLTLVSVASLSPLLSSSQSIRKLLGHS